ncbi:MAG TPA: hypothetical protein VIL99_00535 [Ignavibacteria bacterium]
MRKTVIIIISFLLLFNSFGYILVYFEVKQSLKEEAFDKLSDYIPDSGMEIITVFKRDVINDEEFYKLLEENEIRFKEKMYDVYKKYEKDDTIILYCICDEKENNLDKAFSVYIQNLTTKDSPQPALKNILLNKLSAGILSSESDLFPKEIIELFFNPHQFLISNYPEILTPPPKYII